MYVFYDEKVKKVMSYGIEFSEFINALSKRPHKILILSGEYGTGFDFTTNCEFCVGEDIDEFLQEDVYSYGNFSWVDFETIEGLKSLTPQEVAELFYISKMWSPVNKTYFEKLKNRFIYLAHDDGWFNQTYYKNYLEFKNILSRVITDKVQAIYKIKCVDIDEQVIEGLARLCVKGIGIDFKNLSIEKDESINIPIYEMGEYKDMDEVYSNIRESNIAVTYQLIFKSEWLLEKTL